MPHSSGGGSHGGGFHSSHSSSSGSRSGGSGGHSASGMSVSRRPGPGARRYVYYSRRGIPHYLYISGKREKPDLTTTILLSIIFTSLAALLFWVFASEIRFAPKPLDTASYQTDTVVEDHVGLIEGDTVLPAMNTLLETTGVSPALEIVYESEWWENYTDLETFAYSEYLRLFDDEKHWLVVVSYPDDYASGDFIDWEWEGMIGDDCGPAVNYTSEEAFTKLVHTSLLRSEPETLEDNLATAYTEFCETVMKPQNHWDMLVIAVIIAAVYGLLMYTTVSSYVYAVLAQKAKYCPKGDASVSFEQAPKPRQYNCEYCGTLYTDGTASVCPQCGAPLPAHNDSQR